MNDLVLLARALADPTRIRILAALRQGELCVCELYDALELNQSTLSGHLQIIRQAGLVSTRRQGKWIYYRLEPNLVPMVDMLFAQYEAGLNADKRLRRDADRLARRLQMRADGCCVIGFGSWDSEEKGGEEECDTCCCG
jgi:ArsR family transcriptional regulator